MIDEPQAWHPHPNYPDPALQVLDPRFDKYRLVLASVERLATGSRWAEGPVWFGDGRYLLWSDIPNNRIMKWEEETGVTSVYRRPANFANGNTRDRQGRLVTCEHGTRRITRTEYDGRVTVLAEQFEGKRLNSPNDIVVKSDGSIWFTDPPFGLLSDYEGHRATPELNSNIYRIDPTSGVTQLVSDAVKGPNGLAFSPDERHLYVVQSRATPRNIVVMDVIDAGASLGEPRVLIECGPGIPDGLRCDEDGNLWCGWGMGAPDLDGVMVFSPEGGAIGRIQLPERCANLCFGGPARNRLFMAASHSIYALYVNTRGVGYA